MRFVDGAASDWMDMTRWAECAALARPGHVFELENAEGMTLWTGCVAEIEVPFDWRSPPIRFRLIEEPEAVRSNPIPGEAPR